MELAALVVSFLSPFLPHLLKLGQPAAEAAGKALGEKLGEGTWNKAQAVWNKLALKVKGKPLAKGAAEALAEDAEDEDAKEALTRQLDKVLAANPDLSQALQQLLAADAEAVSKVVTVTQTVTGDKNIVIGSGDGSVNVRQD
ncbi:MAG: hypothetical protein AAF528_00065 [Cyanobacteria bacterium P01_C01_bin.121]